MDNQSCFYIDRLIDFGLGIGIANQMVSIMNQYMRSMDIPGSIQQIERSVAPVYYVAIEDKPVGPLSDGEMANLITQKKVTKDTLSWMPGMTGWQPIEKIPAILKIVALAPPPLPTIK